jgi:methylase of polypeptide subunit release factors
MLTWDNVQNLIKSESSHFAAGLRQAASGNPTEATFRDKLMPVIADFCKKAGIEFLPKGGYSLVSGGKPDTVFNRLVIEYKAPGKLNNSNLHTNNKEAIKQLRGYLGDLAIEDKHRPDRLAGVILDGNYFIFVTIFGKKEYLDSPVIANADSSARFLRYLIYLAYGVALTADNLVNDFGIDQLPARNMIAALEKTLMIGNNPLVQKLFEQWQTFFSEVIEYKEAFTETKLRDLQKFAARAGIDVEIDEQAAKRFFFAIHTYFVLLVKLLAWLALFRYLGLKIGVPSFGGLASLPSEQLKQEIKRMEDGDVFRDWAKITNLLEGDFFRWYLYAWNNDIDKAFREVLARLDTYDPTTLELDPESTRDLLKKLYHYLMPREIRHNLGEYYTPDWLAQMLLNQVDHSFFTDDPDNSSYLRENLLKLKFLDPACGSGTFLVLIIGRIRDAARQLFIPEREILQAIINNVIGFDLNPLAVIAARTNYLLALGSLIEQPHGEISIPVYLADSVMTPYKGEDMFTGGIYHAKTSVKVFEIPQEVVSRERIDDFCRITEEGIHNEVDTAVFMKRAKELLKLSSEEFAKAGPSLQSTYESLSVLHKDHLDGIWARIIKNAFAPIFVGKADYVIGNPPWINWENLPDSYRNESKRLWQEEGLFPHKGMDTILGKGKKDISMLMTHIAMRSYLKDGGKLGFVITQSVFKTAGAGQGFRRFILGDGTSIKVIHVDDMMELQPFEDASNRTSLMVLQKDRETIYPVSYTYWKKVARGRIDFDSQLQEVLAKVQRKNFVAIPVNEKDKTSAWLTGRPRALKAVRKVLGKADYEAHAGVYTGGANGVYWLEIWEKTPDGLVMVTNITEGQKREIPKAPLTALEPDLIYPMLRGRDVKRWQAQPSAWILMAQDPEKRRGIDEKEMQLNYGKTWAYLKQFEVPLRIRAAYKRYFGEDEPFYSMFDIGDYTFSPYKVVWTRVDVDIKGAVVGSADVAGIRKPILPIETAVIVAFHELQEAHYFCAVLNSSPWRFVITSTAVHGTGGFGSPNVLQKARIPKFNPQYPLHLNLAQRSQQAHSFAAIGDDKSLSEVEEEIDCLSGQLWGLTDDELVEIKKSLNEII